MVSFAKPCLYNGQPARILCVDRPGTWPVLFLHGSGQAVGFARINGETLTGGLLTNTPERVSIFGYVFEDGTFGSVASTLKTPNSLEKARADSSLYGGKCKSIIETVYEDGKPVEVKLHSIQNP